MKPFKFSLESLRAPRKQKERAAQQCYAKALAACDEAAARLEKAIADLAAGWDLLTRELATGADADKIKNLRAWCATRENHRNERRAAFEEARRAVEIAFQEMVEAAREREALDCFYDKSRRAHELEVRRGEQKILDEVAARFSGANEMLSLADGKNFNGA